MKMSQACNAANVAGTSGTTDASKAPAFEKMLNQQHELQQQLMMMENMEVREAQAFWNPVESTSARDLAS